MDVNGTLFFAADDGGTGVELWKSDGTGAGTVLVKDIRGGGSSSPHELVDVNGTLFFAAEDVGTGIELWRSDGTGAETVLVKDIRGGGGSSSPHELVDVNGILFFAAHGGGTQVELWKVAFEIITDSDGDGCSDKRENGTDPGRGGLRDPGNRWDYYDVTSDAQGNFAPDGVIDLPNDILGVILHFAPGGYPPADEFYDRAPSVGPNHWNRNSADGVIDLPNDILGVVLQFHHNCLP